MREIAHEQKEIRYKLEKTLGEQRESTKELEMLREERNKLEALLSKYKEN
jgi:septal ring factor EnvC (AmiA/AmiB activator)